MSPRGSCRKHQLLWGSTVAPLNLNNSVFSFWLWILFLHQMRERMFHWKVFKHLDESPSSESFKRVEPGLSEFTLGISAGLRKHFQKINFTESSTCLFVLSFHVDETWYLTTAKQNSVTDRVQCIEHKPLCLLWFPSHRSDAQEWNGSDRTSSLPVFLYEAFLWPKTVNPATWTLLSWPQGESCAMCKSIRPDSGSTEYWI